MIPMKATLTILALVAAIAFSAFAQQTAGPDALLDHMTGHWVLQGMIAGRETTHDVDVEWVLGHEYLQLHETAREKNAQGRAAYEAIVYVEWDEAAKEYRCLWLDSTSGGGIGGTIARARRDGDQIPFLFKSKGGDFHTTFAYNKNSDTWQWIMDGEDGGKLAPFARVKLTRK
jgi:hypothetical protein